MSARIDDVVRWGLLSTAAINGPVLDGCAGSSTVRFAAVASRNADKASAFARAHGIPRAYGSYEELLADPDVEAVYVSLPNALHLEWSRRALEAGKHVLCEKPLGIDPDEVGLAFDAAAGAERRLVEAFMYRFHPQTEQLRQLVAAGAIGSVRLVRATLSFTMTAPETDVRSSVELDGGALMDLGCYCANAFRLFAGEPRLVQAHAVEAASGVDMRFVGTLVGADGAVGQFDCAMDLPRRDLLELVGSEGTIVVPDPWHCRGEPFELRRGDECRRVATPAADAYRVQFETVSRAIRDGRPLEFGRDDAIAQATVLSALRASARTGAPTRVGMA
ncbi:MAG TPA: Gfo/Idh/MocA family oxidoreductase [Conexibacter sp.]